MNSLEKLRSAVRQAPLLGWSAVALLLLAGLLFLVVAVKSGPTVTGTIKVGGVPLAKGSIEFVPVDDQGAIADGRGTGGGATIQEGTYRLEKGLTVGRYRVEIQGTRKTAKKVLNPLLPDEFVPEEKAVVPSKYNQNSILFVEVRAGLNRIDFPDLEPISEKRAKAGK